MVGLGVVVGPGPWEAGETVLVVTFWAQATGVFVLFFAGPVFVACFLLEPKVAGGGDFVVVTVDGLVVVTMDGPVVVTVDGLVTETEVPAVFYKQEKRLVYVLT